MKKNINEPLYIYILQPIISHNKRHSSFPRVYHFSPPLLSNLIFTKSNMPFRIRFVVYYIIILIFLLIIYIRTRSIVFLRLIYAILLYKLLYDIYILYLQCNLVQTLLCVQRRKLHLLFHIITCEWVNKHFYVVNQISN